MWGTTYIASRFLVRDNTMDPTSLALSRFVGATFLIFLVGIYLKRPIFRVPWKTMLLILAQGALGMGLMSLFVFWGQRYTTALNSSMIMSLNPVLTLFGGALFLRERVRFLQWGGILAAVFGCSLVLKVVTLDGWHFSALTKGDLLILLGAFSWSVYTVWGRRTVQKMDGLTYTGYAMLGAIPFLGIMELIQWNSVCLPPGFFDWLIVIYMIIGPTLLAFFAWNEGQRLLPLAVLNVMQYLTPVTVLLLAWPILGESITWLQACGTAIVVLGVALDGIVSQAFRLIGGARTAKESGNDEISMGSGSKPESEDGREKGAGGLD